MGRWLWPGARAAVSAESDLLHGSTPDTAWASLVAQTVKNSPAMQRPGFGPSVHLRQSCPCPPAGKWRSFCEGTLPGTYALLLHNVHIQICSVYKSKDVFSSCFQSLKVILASFCFSQLPEQWKMLGCEPGWWCWGNVRLGFVLCSVAFSLLSSQLPKPCWGCKASSCDSAKQPEQTDTGNQENTAAPHSVRPLFLRTNGTGLIKQMPLFRLDSRSHPLPLELHCPRELMKMSYICTVPYSNR